MEYPLGKGSIDTSAVPGLEEARTAAKLSDSSIVQVYDFEVQDGMAYLILEYVDGMTLAEVLHIYPTKWIPILFPPYSKRWQKRFRLLMPIRCFISTSSPKMC